MLRYFSLTPTFIIEPYYRAPKNRRKWQKSVKFFFPILPNQQKSGKNPKKFTRNLVPLVGLVPLAETPRPDVINAGLCRRVCLPLNGVRQSVLLPQNGSFSRKAVLCVRSRSRLSIGVHLSRPYKALSTPCLTGNSSHKSVHIRKRHTKTPNIW